MAIPPRRQVTNYSDAAAPAQAAIKLTKGTAFANGPCRAFWCGTAGTLNGVDMAGNTLTNFPAQVGLNPLSLSVLSAGGTADDIWALY